MCIPPPSSFLKFSCTSTHFLSLIRGFEVKITKKTQSIVISRKNRTFLCCNWLRKSDSKTTLKKNDGSLLSSSLGFFMNHSSFFLIDLIQALNSKEGIGESDIEVGFVISCMHHFFFTTGFTQRRNIFLSAIIARINKRRWIKGKSFLKTKPLNFKSFVLCLLCTQNKMHLLIFAYSSNSLSEVQREMMALGKNDYVDPFEKEYVPLDESQKISREREDEGRERGKVFESDEQVTVSQLTFCHLQT